MGIVQKYVLKEDKHIVAFKQNLLLGNNSLNLKIKTYTIQSKKTHAPLLLLSPPICE